MTGLNDLFLTGEITVAALIILAAAAALAAYFRSKYKDRSDEYADRAREVAKDLVLVQDRKIQELTSTIAADRKAFEVTHLAQNEKIAALTEEIRVVKTMNLEQLASEQHNIAETMKLMGKNLEAILTLLQVTHGNATVNIQAK